MMKNKFLLMILVIILLLGFTSSISAVSVGVGGNPNKLIIKNKPYIFQCGETKLYSTEGVELNRNEYYIFENEKLFYKILVIDLNGVDNIKEVYTTYGSSPIIGNQIGANCVKLNDNLSLNECDLNGFENEIGEYDPNIMEYYNCTLPIQNRQSIYGQYYISIEAKDIDESPGILNKYDYKFFNPSLAISIDGDITIINLKPGHTEYSDTILVANEADDSSRVPVYLYISGTSLTDSVMNEHFDCPGGLNPSDISYFAVNGAWSTQNDPGADNEGYVPLNYNSQMVIFNPDWNILYPGAEMTITFKITAPINCIGYFDQGNVIFSMRPIDNNIEIVTNSLTPNVMIIPVCSSDLECNDDNLNTNDICRNPGTKDSYCENIRHHPEALISFNENTNDFIISGISNNNLAVSVNYDETCLRFGTYYSCDRTYLINDELNNTLELKTSMKNFHNFVIQNEILSLKYNDQEKIIPNQNVFSMVLSRNKRLFQNIFIKDIFSVLTFYNPLTNKTTIQLRENEETTNSIKEGLYISKLVTDNGNLKYKID